MTPLPTTTGLILAGGAGRRVDGRDKGLIVWHDRPMVAHVADRLRPQVDRLLISCNRNFAQYAAIASETIADTRRDYQGPLAGIEAAIEHIHTDYFVISACDTPTIPGDLVQRLLQPMLATDGKRIDICFAHDGERGQYLCAALRSACLATLPEYLDNGQRAVRHWYESQRCVAVDFSDEADSFSNFNHMD